MAANSTDTAYRIGACYQFGCLFSFFRFINFKNTNTIMIKANDLRIGNKVLNDSSICEVNHIYGMDFINCSLKTKQGNYINAHYELIEPIQLNEEWLLSAGFEKLTSIEKGFKSNSYTYSKGFSFIVHLNNGLLSTNFWQGNEKKFVHELQNLFFSLTGEDLVFSTEP